MHWTCLDALITHYREVFGEHEGKYGMDSSAIWFVAETDTTAKIA